MTAPIAIPQQPKSPTKRSRRLKQNSLPLHSSFFNMQSSNEDDPLSIDSFGSNSSLPTMSLYSFPPPLPEKKSVTFGSIEMNEHQVILGDNPSVSDGPPLTIAWKSHVSYSISVDEHEKSRPKRSGSKVLPRNVREELLTKAGYSQEQLARAQENVDKAKKERAVNACLQNSMLAKLLKPKSKQSNRGIQFAVAA